MFPSTTEPEPPVAADIAAGAAGEWTVEPRQAGIAARAREVWRYRRLLMFFAQRALQKVYRNTILGRTWLLIRPLFPLLVKTLIFGGVLGVGSDGVPYFLFLVVGSAAWDLFASSLMWATRSLELNRGLLGRVYVPRVILPLAMTAPGVLNYLIYLAVIAGTLGFYFFRDGILYTAPPAQLPWAILATLLIASFSFAIGLFTSVLGTTARDVRFTLAYVLDFWFFLTPVLYPVSAMPEHLRWITVVNPMAAFVQTFKFGLLGVGAVDVRALGIAAAVTAVTLGFGLWYFARAEAGAMDRV